MEIVISVMAIVAIVLSTVALVFSQFLSFYDKKNNAYPDEFQQRANSAIAYMEAIKEFQKYKMQSDRRWHDLQQELREKGKEDVSE